MIVGEPVMMGGDLGHKDERRITRLENSHTADFVTSSRNHSTPPALNGINLSTSTGDYLIILPAFFVQFFL